MFENLPIDDAENGYDAIMDQASALSNPSAPEVVDLYAVSAHGTD